MRIPKSVVLLALSFVLGALLTFSATIDLAQEEADEAATERTEAAEAHFRVALRHIPEAQLQAEWLHELNRFPNEAANRAASAGPQ